MVCLVNFIVVVNIIQNEIIIAFIIEWIRENTMLIVSLYHLIWIILINITINIQGQIILNLRIVFKEYLTAVVSTSEHEGRVFALQEGINHYWWIAESNLVSCRHIPCIFRTVNCSHHHCIWSIYINLK